MPAQQNWWRTYGGSAICLVAYIPLIIGGWKQPSDINLGCFIPWIALSATIGISMWLLDNDTWRVQTTFFIGNVATVVAMLIRGGYTMNLDLQTKIVGGGLIMVICAWIIYGSKTKRWKPEILYLGGTAVDMASFYPIFKQLIGDHDSPTWWTLSAWVLFGTGMAVITIWGERFFDQLLWDRDTYRRMIGEEKSFGRIFLVSAFSVENVTMVTTTVILMIR